MNSVKRPFLRSFIFILIIVSAFLAGCTGQIANQSWPGLSTDGETVYVAYGPQVLAYNVEAQQPLWSFPSEPGGSLFFYAPPSVQDNRVVIGDYGASRGLLSPGIAVTIYALEDGQQTTPDLLWSDDTLARDRIVAPPLQVGDRAFVGTADNMVLALDATTGAELWRFSTGHSIWAQPAYHEGTLYVASLDRHLYALDAESGTEVWRARLSGALSSTPVVGDGLVYVASFGEQLHALDLETGAELWTADAEDWLWGAPALADGVLYFADSQGNLYAVEADSGNEIWRASATGSVLTSPVVAEGIVYLASEGDREAEQGMLAAYSAESGEQLWQQLTPAPLYTTPVIINDEIIVALQSESALLLAFDLENGGQRWSFAPPAA